LKKQDKNKKEHKIISKVFTLFFGRASESGVSFLYGDYIRCDGTFSFCFNKPLFKFVLLQAIDLFVRRI